MLSTPRATLRPFDTAALLIIERQKGSVIRTYFCADVAWTAASPQNTELPPSDHSNLSRQTEAPLSHYRVRLDDARPFDSPVASTAPVSNGPSGILQTAPRGEVSAFEG